MRVGIIQSNYIPWRGYFDFIDGVDLFIFHDDLQYTKGDWRNRNRIKTPKGSPWLTVPVHHAKTDQLIEETPIDYSRKWYMRHLRQLEAGYRRAPFFDLYTLPLADILSREFSSISELNVALCKWMMEVLDICTPTCMSRDLGATGRKSERLIELLAKVGGTTYVSGPSARAYLDMDLFRRHGILVEYKSYDYPAYPQLWGEFAGEVTALDLLYNTGPDARGYLHSRSPNRIAE